MKGKKIFTDAVVYAVLIFAAFVTLIPLIFVLSGSFKTNSELMSHPESLIPIAPTINNYIQAWSSEYINVPVMLRNSIFYTVCSVAIALLTCTTAGYAFARGKFKLKGVIFGALVAFMFVDVGSITIYPKFEVLALIGLTKGLPALLVLKFFTVSTANIFLVRNFVAAIPIELDEAAKIDGCGFIGTFFRVIAPMLKPLVATLGLLAFQGSWNDYLMPAIFTMTVPEQQTLIVGITALKGSGAAAANWNMMFAAAVIALVPVVFAYVVANKYFVSGLAAGAVKG